jgi:hypothetical protein
MAMSQSKVKPSQRQCLSPNLKIRKTLRSQSNSQAKVSEWRAVTLSDGAPFIFYRLTKTHTELSAEGDTSKKCHKAYDSRRPQAHKLRCFKRWHLDCQSLTGRILTL